jgi:ABC-type nitrate/sulfonate/bicarbonate transport system ATPase subunit
MISLNTHLSQASGTSRLPKAAPGVARGAADQAAPRPSRIVARGLAKRFGDLRIFEDVNFEVGEREVVAIVGPSGCGKTTLLRCIAGLTPYESGMISIEDQAVTGPALGLAVVFQHFGLFPWKTVYANVAFSLRMAGASREEVSSEVPRFLEMLGLKGFENAYPYQISSGMQQRCGLARALAIEPKVMLMDEPFGAIDAQRREILQFELMRIWDLRPTSMVFVTHSIEEAVLMEASQVTWNSAARASSTNVFQTCSRSSAKRARRSVSCVRGRGSSTVMIREMPLGRPLRTKTRSEALSSSIPAPSGTTKQSSAFWYSPHAAFSSRP